MLANHTPEPVKKHKMTVFCVGSSHAALERYLIRYEGWKLVPPSLFTDLTLYPCYLCPKIRRQPPGIRLSCSTLEKRGLRISIKSIHQALDETELLSGKVSPAHVGDSIFCHRGYD
jgi:hypothetical protein